MKTLLLLEDNITAALEIELIVEEVGGFICKVADNLTKANKMYSDNTPNLIIADIKLGNGEISLDWLQSKAGHTPTIIISGHSSDEFYHRALQLEAIAYMVKPVDKVSLKFELQRILNNEEESSGPNIQIAIKDGSNTHLINEDQITAVSTEGNYSTIQVTDKKLVLKTSLLKIMKLLDQDKFIRVHRSKIVAFDRIQEINYKEDHIKLIDDSIVPLGKTYKPLLREKLKNSNQI